MKVLDVIAVILIIVGGLNWGLVGIFSFDLIATIFGIMSVVSRIVYILFAIGAIYQIVFWNAIKKRWHPSA